MCVLELQEVWVGRGVYSKQLGNNGGLQRDGSVQLGSGQSMFQKMRRTGEDSDRVCVDLT
jgi:hypothetical protein